MYRTPVVSARPGQFMGGSAAATLDILQQVQKAGSAQAFRNTVHIKDEALLVSGGRDGWDGEGEEEEEGEGNSGIRARIATAVDAAAQARWVKQQHEIHAAALAHLELTMPLARRASYFKQRVELRKATEVDRKEAEEALAAEAEDTRPADFNFAGDGRPFRLACGKASRIRGGREAIRTIGTQLREGRLELREESGTVREVSRNTPFGGCGMTGLLAHAQVRCPFRDFVVEWARDNSLHYTGKPGGWRDGGMRYTSLGSGELLFDLELLERIRGLGVRIAQICLIDKAYRLPLIGTMRALQEFADWQRAAALLDREEPAEILVFGSVEDYEKAAEDRAKGCHLLMHCDAFQEGLLEDDQCERLAMRVLCHGGLLARLTNVRSGAGFNAAAWALVPGGPAYQGGVDLQAINDPLLVACNAAIGSPAVQMKVQVQALAWAQKEAEAQKKAVADAEAAKGKPRQKTPAELQELEEKAREADRESGLSEAQMLARARMRARERQQGGEEAPRPARKTAMQERAGHYGLPVYRVLQKPHVAVRDKPKGTAKIIGQIDFGQELIASKEKVGQWVRISEGPIGSNFPAEAWVLSDASEGLGLSMMLEKVQ